MGFQKFWSPQSYLGAMLPVPSGKRPSAPSSRWERCEDPATPVCLSVNVVESSCLRENIPCFSVWIQQPCQKMEVVGIQMSMSNCHIVVYCYNCSLKNPERS